MFNLFRYEKLSFIIDYSLFTHVGEMSTFGQFHTRRLQLVDVNLGRKDMHVGISNPSIKLT